MKKLLSALLVSTFIMTTFAPKKAEAGVILFSAGAALTITGSYAQNRHLLFHGRHLMIGGVVTGAIGIFLLSTPVGITLVTLAEAGPLSQNDLEVALSQKYPFIQDNKVIADLATLVKSRVESEKMVDGMKMVSLSEAEIKSVLESTDLMETHASEVQLMINDLK